MSAHISFPYLINLQNLDIRSNQLNGSIPQAVGNMTNLKHLDFGGQNLTGGIPLELFNLRNLEELFLNDNKLGCYDYDFECFEFDFHYQRHHHYIYHDYVAVYIDTYQHFAVSFGFDTYRICTLVPAFLMESKIATESVVIS